MPPIIANPHAVSPTRSGYLPSLDGWRSIAIIGVLFTHDIVRRVGPFTDSFFNRYGGYGVSLFFAISGLLICTRLLEEEALVGRIDLKGFYIRRVLRIQPAALVYLAAIALLTLAGWIHEHWQYWLGALFLYRNFLWNGASPEVIANGIFTGHFWSLAVEEHFYLLLSLLLFFVPRRLRLPLLAVLILLVSAWGHFSVRHPALFNVDTSIRHTDQLLNLLLIPATYAVLLQRRRIRALALRWVHPCSTALAGAAVFALISAVNYVLVAKHLHKPIYSSKPDFIVALCPFLIISTMLHPASWTTRLLELPVFRYLGKWSYSLYLWHVLFFFREIWPPHLHPPVSPLSAISVAPWKYLFSLLFAILSFYLVEKPLMRLGHRLAPPATPGRDDLGTEISAASAQEQLHPVSHA